MLTKSFILPVNLNAAACQWLLIIQFQDVSEFDERFDQSVMEVGLPNIDIEDSKCGGFCVIEKLMDRLAGVN